MQHSQSFRTAEVVGFEIGAGGDEISAADGKLMGRSVWPGRRHFRHGRKNTPGQRKQPAFGARRQSAAATALWIRQTSAHDQGQYPTHHAQSSSEERHRSQTLEAAP